MGISFCTDEPEDPLSPVFLVHEICIFTQATVDSSTLNENWRAGQITFHRQVRMLTAVAGRDGEVLSMTALGGSTGV